MGLITGVADGSGEGSLLGLEVVGFSVGEVLMGRKDGSSLGGRVTGTVGA